MLISLRHVTPYLIELCTFVTAFLSLGLNLQAKCVCSTARYFITCIGCESCGNRIMKFVLNRLQKILLAVVSWYLERREIAGNIIHVIWLLCQILNFEA